MAEDIAFLDYDPPRAYAAAARVGQILFLAGEDGKIWTGPSIWTIPEGGIEPQAEQMWQNIQRTLHSLGSDVEYIFKCTTYYVDFADRAVAAEVRRRYLPRPVPGTSVQVVRLSDPTALIEVDVTALVPARTAPALVPNQGRPTAVPPIG